jgi:hypothetical protein
MWEFYQTLSDSFIITLLLLTIVFAFGIVWRVEKELDLSYKFLLGAIMALTCGEVLALFNASQSVEIYFLITASKILFAVLLFSGILTMRNILREMDGEQEDIKK